MMDDAVAEDISRPPIWLPPARLDPVTETDIHVLLWQVRGAGDVLARGELYPLSAGSAVWVPAGIEHSFTTQENSVVIPLFFDVSETATTQSVPTVIKVDRELRTLLLAGVQALFGAKIQRNANIARQILALIEENPVVVATLPMPKTDAAHLVAEALLFNPGDDRSVEALARAAHASVSKIERAFLSETGITLRQWRMRNRMETAGILLRSPTMIDAVAQRVGYTNVSAFYRVFRTHFGMTPGEYVARFRAQ